MTDLRGIAPDATSRMIEAEGIDLCSLLFAWLDGCLAAYGADYFIGRRVAVTHWGRNDMDGRWYIRAIAYGEIFEFGRHSQGTEVKAMTYSNMQIFDGEGNVFSANDAIDADNANNIAAVAVANTETMDSSKHVAAVTAPAPATAAASEVVNGESASTDKAGLRKGIVDVYVIIDI